MAARRTIDASPECDEVIHRRQQGYDEHEPDCNARDQLNADDEAEEIPLIPAVSENRCYNGDNLQDHFQLAKIARLNGKAFGGGDAAQAGDQELAPEHENNDPRRHEVGGEADEEDESGGNQEFIRHGIKENSYAADLAVLAREVAVKAIGDRGQNKDSGS